MPRGIPGSQAGSVWVARETFACELDGEQIIVQAGQTRAREGHPLLTTYREMFEPAETGIMFEVEQATAAPGEKRGAQSDAKPAEKPADKPAEKEDEPKGKGGPLSTSDVKES